MISPKTIRKCIIHEQPYDSVCEVITQTVPGYKQCITHTELLGSLLIGLIGHLTEFNPYN